MNFCHDLHTSLHLVRFLLSNSSKICLAMGGDSSNNSSIFDNFTLLDKTFLMNPNIFFDTVLKYDASARNIACSCVRRGEKCLVSYPHSLSHPSHYTQCIQHVSLVTVVATTQCIQHVLLVNVVATT